MLGSSKLIPFLCSIVLENSEGRWNYFHNGGRELNIEASNANGTVDTARYRLVSNRYIFDVSTKVSKVKTFLYLFYEKTCTLTTE